MKTIGLIGGMSWESTLVYYRIVNQRVKEALGGLHSAKVLLHSVDFEEIASLQRSGDWHAAGKRLGDAASSLEKAGADCVVVCTNTMHKVADQIQDSCQIPLIHIASSVGETLRAQGITKVGLLGTRFTMEQPFLKERLATYGLEVIVPEEETRAEVHRIIFEELCCGIILPSSRETYEKAITKLGTQGARAVILGCTEIGLLLSNYQGALPILDTTVLHAESAVRFALN